MRGGRTACHAPLGILLFAFLLAACKLNLNGYVPYLELQINPEYPMCYPEPSLPNDYIQYKFFADEPVLRCRYALSLNGELLHAGETETQTAGEWYNLPLNISELIEGKYQLDLVVQAERSREFVDLAFLKKSISFFRDTTPPAEPEVDLEPDKRYTERKYVAFSHPEWPETTGSPVMVFYTTDETEDPNPNDPNDLYKGSPFFLPFESGTVTLKAIAVDAAGNQSEPITNIYYFTYISYVYPPEGIGSVTIYINGFGFLDVDENDIRMTDAAGTERELYFSSGSISENQIRFMVDLHATPAAPPGQAIISVTNNVPNSVTVTIPFLVK